MRRGRTVLVLLLALLLLSLAYACSSALKRPAPPPVTPSPGRWASSDLSIAWLGHASVLIGFAGTTILTDPTLFDRIGVEVGPITVGPKRLVRSALAAADIPALDVVLVSHAHMDSLDRPSLRQVSKARLLVVPKRTRDLVDDLGFQNIVELGWGDQVSAGEVTIEAVELKHWGRRVPWDAWRGYNGYLLTKGEVSVLFASDTAYTEAIGAISQRQELTAAIIGNGAYDPWIHNHANPEQVWQMFKQSGARYLLPIHWDTFRLGKEPIGEAMARLLAAAGPEAERVVIRRHGETFTLPCCERVARSSPH